MNIEGSTETLTIGPRHGKRLDVTAGFNLAHWMVGLTFRHDEDDGEGVIMTVMLGPVGLHFDWRLDRP